MQAGPLRGYKEVKVCIGTILLAGKFPEGVIAVSPDRFITAGP